MEKQLDFTLEVSPSSLSTVKKCTADIKFGHLSIHDDEHSGHPKTPAIEEIVLIIHSAILNDR